MDSFNLKNNIFICIISYRNKNFIETIDSAILNCSGKNKIFFEIIIQDSNQKYIERDGYPICIHYKKWDDYTGFSFFKNFLFSRAPKNSYIMYVMPGTKFKNNWDANILNLKNLKETVVTTKNNCIDTNFMFFHKDIFIKFGFPYYLKMFGESEEFSLRMHMNQIKMIDKLNEYIIIDSDENYDYVPFSKTHKYNQVEKLYEYGYNDYINLIKNEKSIEKIKQYSWQNTLKKYYDIMNDVEYTENDLPRLSPKRYENWKEFLYRDNKDEND